MKISRTNVVGLALCVSALCHCSLLHAALSAGIANYQRITSGGVEDFPPDQTVQPSANYVKALQSSVSSSGFFSTENSSVSAQAAMSSANDQCVFQYSASYSVSTLITTNFQYPNAGEEGANIMGQIGVSSSAGYIRYRVMFEAIGAQHGSQNTAFLANMINDGVGVPALFGRGVLTGITKSGGYSTVQIFGTPGFNTLSGPGQYYHNYSVSCQAAFQELRPNSFRYFGIGVNWSTAGNPNLRCVRGDLDASNLKNHLQSNLPTFVPPGTVVALNASTAGTDNANTITTQFNLFKTTVGPDDTVVFFISSHGESVGLLTPLFTVIPISEDSVNSLSEASLFVLLTSLPPTARKVLILDTCHAGGLAGLARQVPNLQIAAASTAEGTTSSSPNDCTGLFTDFLNEQLDTGIFDLSKIIGGVTPGTYNNYIGQSLALKDSGNAIFTGLNPQLYEGSHFDGDLLGRSYASLQAVPKFFNVGFAGGNFTFSLTNVPTHGALAIETSADLTLWSQVAFNAGLGTNLNYVFPTTNLTAAFFRAKFVP